MKPCSHVNCTNQATHRLSTRFPLCVQHYFHLQNEKKRDKAILHANTNRRSAYPKTTGEAAIFKQIWLERKHVSEVSGSPLGEEMNVCFMAHILPKSAFGKWRLHKTNIVLMTSEEHNCYDKWPKDKAIKAHPGLARIYELKEKYKIEYSQELRKGVKP